MLLAEGAGLYGLLSRQEERTVHALTHGVGGWRARALSGATASLGSTRGLFCGLGDAPLRRLTLTRSVGRRPLTGAPCTVGKGIYAPHRGRALPPPPGHGTVHRLSPRYRAPAVAAATGHGAVHRFPSQLLNGPRLLSLLAAASAARWQGALAARLPI